MLKISLNWATFWQSYLTFHAKILVNLLENLALYYSTNNHATLNVFYGTKIRYINITFQFFKHFSVFTHFVFVFYKVRSCLADRELRKRRRLISKAIWRWEFVIVIPVMNKKVFNHLNMTILCLPDFTYNIHSKLFST